MSPHKITKISILMLIAITILNTPMAHSSEKPFSFKPVFKTTGNVFVKDQKIVIGIDFSKSKFHKKRSYAFSYMISNSFNKQLFAEPKKMEINKKRYHEITPNVSELGWYKVSITVFENNIQKNTFNENLEGNQNYFSFAVLPKIDQQNQFFGVCEHFLNDKNASLMKNAGIGWIRIDTFWDTIQTKRKSFNYKRMDNILKIANKHQIKILPIIDYGVPWASSAPSHIKGYERTRYTPESAAYIAFLESLINRYKTHIQTWEIWNEPNIHFWKSPKKDYAELLKLSFQIINSIDPTALILMGGMSETHPSWINMLEKEQAIHSFQAYNIHPYHYQVAPEKRLPKELRVFTAATEKIEKKPIWITEIGAPTNIVSLQEQAQYLIRDAVISLAAGIEKFFCYELADHHVDPNDREANFGILFHDLSPKPAYVAYAILTQQLMEAKYIKKYALNSKSAYGYQFLKKRQEVLVLWTTKEKEEVSIHLDAEQAIITNMMGHETTIAVKQGALMLTLTKNPIYIKKAEK